MELLEALRKIGLSETEAKIFLALLKKKESTAVQLAKETAVHRRTIYDNLNILLQKGLVSMKKKENVTYFQTTNPESLHIFLEEKNQIFNDILPTLQSLYEKDQISPRISVFVGLEGAKAVVEEITRSTATTYWMGGGLFFFQALKYSRAFVEQKVKTMNIKTIQPDIPEVRALLSIMPKQNIRVLPRSFMARAGYLVSHDTVAIGIIQEQEVTTIKIINKECADAFTNYFHALWLTGRPLR